VQERTVGSLVTGADGLDGLPDELRYLLRRDVSGRRPVARDAGAVASPFLLLTPLPARFAHGKSLGSRQGARDGIANSLSHRSGRFLSSSAATIRSRLSGHNWALPDLSQVVRRGHLASVSGTEPSGLTPEPLRLTAHFRGHRPAARDGVVDEDGGDGRGGREGVGVEDPGAGCGAVDEQCQLLAELFWVDGAGFAGGVGEAGCDGFLVVACVPGGGVLGVVEFDGGGDVGARGGGGGDVEGGEKPLAGREVSAVEHAGQDGGVEPAQVLGDELVLAGEVLVGRALGHLGRGAELVHASAVDALLAEQLLGRAEDALAGAPAAAQALGALLQLRHSSRVPHQGNDRYT